MISQCWGWGSEEVRRGAASAGVANVTKAYKCTGSWGAGKDRQRHEDIWGFLRVCPSYSMVEVNSY